MRLKNIQGEKSHLFAYLCFCAFVLLLGCVFVLLCCLWVWNLFVKKEKKKKFKTALITSFTFLLNLPYYKQEFFLSQSFSIITIFFNYHNLLYLFYHFVFSNLFTIFLNLFTTCDTIFMKISQRMNSII